MFVLNGVHEIKDLLSCEAARGHATCVDSKILKIDF